MRKELSLVSLVAALACPWSLTVAQSSLSWARRNPHFAEVAPCACDITRQKCDQGCCCDKECSAAANENVTCANLSGGFDRGKIVAANCSARSLGLTDLHLGDGHPILCVSEHNAPFLGLYYDESPSLIATADFNAVLSPAHLRKATFAVSEAVDSPKGSSYVEGSSIDVVHDRANAAFGLLALPVATTSSGLCVSSPVRFLVPTRSSCPRLISRRSCSRGEDGSALDPKSYLQGGGTEPFVRTFLGSSSAAQVTVRLFGTNVEVHGQQVGAPVAIAPETDSEVSVVEHISGLRRKQAAESLPFVSVDNFSSLANLSSVQPLTPGPSSCENVVLETHYRLRWRGTSIIGIEAFVLVGNISLAKGVAQLTQHFSTTFIHSPEANAVREISARSGNPGYEHGRPVLVGRGETFNVWRGDASSLCRSAGVESIAFGVDVSSGCLLALTRSNFSDCSALRSSVRGVFSATVSAELVAKGGDPNVTLEDDYVRVLFADEEEPNVTLSSSSSSCVVPSGLSIRVTFSRALGLGAGSVLRLNGVRVAPSWRAWRWTCSNGDKCSQNKFFQLRISVAFAEIPLVWHHQNTTRFWILQDLSYCSGDSCWTELMMPFTHADTGDAIASVAQFAMLLSFAGITILIITRHYW